MIGLLCVNRVRHVLLACSACDIQCSIVVLQETFVPLPLAEGPKFEYVAPQVTTDGPAAPQMEVLAARGSVEACLHLLSIICFYLLGVSVFYRFVMFCSCYGLRALRFLKIFCLSLF